MPTTIKYKVTDRAKSFSYLVDSKQAELMLARGEVSQPQDNLRILILRTTAPRGDHREWRKTRCYDPTTGGTTMTMQLVPLGSHLDAKQFRKRNPDTGARRQR